MLVEEPHRIVALASAQLLMQPLEGMSVALRLSSSRMVKLEPYVPFELVYGHSCTAERSRARAEQARTVVRWIDLDA